MSRAEGTPPHHPPSSSGLGNHSPVFLPGKSQGRRTWWAAVHGVAKSDTTERLPFHFLLSCIGEGNGNPLQCSCLENPVEKGAWWAAVHGVAQSWKRLKHLSIHTLKKAMATHSSILAWRIPWTEEPGGLLSMGSHRVGHN